VCQRRRGTSSPSVRILGGTLVPCIHAARQATITKSCSFRSRVTFTLPRRLHPKTLMVSVRYRGNAVLTAKSAKGYSVKTA
jgi:hypothetical protein